MTTYLCRIENPVSEPDLRQIIQVEADSFEEAASRLFPNMEIMDPHPTGHDDRRLVSARFLPANEVGVTHRYTTSGYFCQRFASLRRMPEGWAPHPPEAERPTVAKEPPKQWTLEAWCR